MISKNQIVARLSPAVMERLEPYLSPVSLEQGDLIYRTGESLLHCYFPINCLFSVTITMQNGATAEVGMIGNRGMLGITALLGGSETNQTDCAVQIGGTALKIEAQIMQQEFDRNGELRDLMQRYTYAFLSQVSQTAACNSLHTLEQRLPRWLLETQERIDSDSLPLTQEFIAMMLGVRRAGVTQIAQKLQERKLIQYRRGNVTILNQAGLEASACECFHVVRKQYDRLLGEKQYDRLLGEKQ